MEIQLYEPMPFSYRNLVMEIRKQVGAFKIMFSLNSTLDPDILIKNLEQLLDREKNVVGPESMKIDLHRYENSDRVDEQEDSVFDNDLMEDNNNSSSCLLLSDTSLEGKTWEEICWEAVDNLWKHADAEPFQYPVDLLEYPDYSTVIQTPTCLQLIKDNLGDGVYQSAAEFHEAVMLIFENCHTYNGPPACGIRRMAKRLQTFYTANDQLRKLLHDDESRSSVKGTDGEEDVKNVSRDGNGLESQRDNSKPGRHSTRKRVERVDHDEKNSVVPASTINNPRRRNIKRNPVGGGPNLKETDKHEGIDDVQLNKIVADDEGGLESQEGNCKRRRCSTRKGVEPIDNDEKNSIMPVSTNNNLERNFNTNNPVSTGLKLQEADKYLVKVPNGLGDGKDTFKCLICQKMLSPKFYNSRLHVRRVHLLARMECPKCQHKCYDHSSFKRHLTTCTGGKKLEGRMLKASEVIKTKSKQKLAKINRRNEQKRYKPILQQAEERDKILTLADGLVVTDPPPNFDLRRCLSVQIKLKRLRKYIIRSPAQNMNSVTKRPRCRPLLNQPKEEKKSVNKNRRKNKNKNEQSGLSQSIVVEEVDLTLEPTTSAATQASLTEPLDDHIADKKSSSGNLSVDDDDDGDEKSSIFEPLDHVNDDNRVLSFGPLNDYVDNDDDDASIPEPSDDDNVEYDGQVEIDDEANMTEPLDDLMNDDDEANVIPDTPDSAHVTSRISEFIYTISGYPSPKLSEIMFSKLSETMTKDNPLKKSETKLQFQEEHLYHQLTLPPSPGPLVIDEVLPEPDQQGPQALMHPESSSELLPLVSVFDVNAVISHL